MPRKLDTNTCGSFKGKIPYTPADFNSCSLKTCMPEHCSRPRSHHSRHGAESHCLDWASALDQTGVVADGYERRQVRANVSRSPSCLPQEQDALTQRRPEVWQRGVAWVGGVSPCS